MSYSKTQVISMNEYKTKCRNKECYMHGPGQFCKNENEDLYKVEDGWNEFYYCIPSDNIKNNTKNNKKNNSSNKTKNSNFSYTRFKSNPNNFSFSKKLVPNTKSFKSNPNNYSKLKSSKSLISRGGRKKSRKGKKVRKSRL